MNIAAAAPAKINDKCLRRGGPRESAEGLATEDAH